MDIEDIGGKFYPATINKIEMTEARPDSISNLAKEASSYFEAKTELWKLKAANSTTEALSTVVSQLVLILISVMILSAFNIGAALLIGKWLGQVYTGFFIVAGFYLLIGIFVYANRHTWLKGPFYKMLINKFLK